MKAIKKLLALMLALVMLFALCACGDDTSKKDDKKDDKKTTTTTQSDKTDPDGDSDDKDEEADPEDIAKVFAKAMAEYDYVSMFDLCAFDFEAQLQDEALAEYDDEAEFFEELSDEYETKIDSWKDAYAAVLKEEQEWLKDGYGSDYKIKAKITDTAELDEDEIDDIIDYLLDEHADYINEKKVKKISEGMDITIDITITGEDDEETETVIVTMVKYDGEWKVADYNYEDDYEDEYEDEYEDDYEDSGKVENVVPLGTWCWDGLTMTLVMGGTGTLSYGSDSMDITWEIVDGKLVLTNEEGDEEVLEYSVSGNTLTCIDQDGEEMIWTRKTATNDQPADNDSSPVGYWGMDGIVMVLEDDGSGSICVSDSEEIELNWVADGNKIAILMGGEEYYAEYSISGNKLTLEYEDGSVEVWTEE